MTSMADNAPRLDNFYNEMISVYHTFLRLIQAAVFFKCMLQTYENLRFLTFENNRLNPSFKIPH